MRTFVAITSAAQYLPFDRNLPRNRSIQSSCGLRDMAACKDTGWISEAEKKHTGYRKKDFFTEEKKPFRSRNRDSFT